MNQDYSVVPTQYCLEQDKEYRQNRVPKLMIAVDKPWLTTLIHI